MTVDLSMTISTQMQAKIDKIDKLIQEGYTLKKTNFGFIDFKNTNGKNVQILGRLFKKSPAGFSWIAFFFPAIVCTQIREWSYFYVAGTYWIIASLFQPMTSIDGSSAAGFGLSIIYGYMFPYLRKLSSEIGTTDMPKGRSIVIGILLSIACTIPSLIIDIVFGNF